MALDPQVALGLVALLGVAVAASRVATLGHARGVLTAGARATVQLAVLSFVLAAVLRSGALTVAFLLLMLTVAAATSARRIGTPMWAAALSIGVPAAVVLAVLLGSGAVPTAAVSVLPVGGIVIGGAMSAATLAGRRGAAELSVRAGEVEAGLALGLGPREATRPVLAHSAAEALVPALDQTRTVGLVTLPGVFVGLLLGGSTPLQAALAQLVVLVALLAAEAMSAGLAVELLWRRRWDGARILGP